MPRTDVKQRQEESDKKPEESDLDGRNGRTIRYEFGKNGGSCKTEFSQQQKYKTFVHPETEIHKGTDFS
jgi:hypothetical protein